MQISETGRCVTKKKIGTRATNYFERRYGTSDNTFTPRSTFINIYAGIRELSSSSNRPVFFKRRCWFSTKSSGICISVWGTRNIVRFVIRRRRFAHNRSIVLAEDRKVQKQIDENIPRSRIEHFASHG